MYLLDKNIVRAVFEARARVRRRLIPLHHTSQLAPPYRLAQLTTVMSPEEMLTALMRGKDWKAKCTASSCHL
jgi:hypothetical protein